MQEPLLENFMRFGLAGLIGFAIGLERAMAGSENPHAGTRDFILFSLIGAVSAFVATRFNNSWLILAGFTGALALLLAGYWTDREHDSGITTEVSALFTFFLGVLVMLGAPEIAIALAIVTLAILSQKKAIRTITDSIHRFELQAALKFLIITFIILPVLPNQTLATYLPASLDLAWLHTMLQALNPYRIWLIVILVSLISLVGYVLIKVLGPGAGTGLTGLIGGLASSTVTTVAFARRSLETPALNKGFAIAILLASSIMFPRLLLEIAIVNQPLMKNSLVPLMAMGGTGMILAFLLYIRSNRELATGRTTMQLENPFCLKSAITFGLVFSVILMLTRLATTYLGNRWLPVMAVLSGLVDADAIAFSLSDANKSGIISLDWASFNLVLAALSNTFVKLLLVLLLGHRQLFRQLLVIFLFMGTVGICTTFLSYDLPATPGTEPDRTTQVSYALPREGGYVAPAYPE